MTRTELDETLEGLAADVKHREHMTKKSLPRKEPSRRRDRMFLVILAAIVVLASASNLFVTRTSADDFTFGSENVTKGYTASAANRNSADGSYESLIEGDQYADTNYSGSSENVVTGTTGGGSFPSALDTDDATRRNYIEANGAVSPTYQIIRPNADGSPLTMTTFPASPTTHYTKVNQVAKDDETSYNAGVATGGGEKDIYGMTDPSDPGGTPNIDVTMWIYARGVTAPQCSLTYGLYIGTTSYVGATPLITTTTYTNYSYTWTLNPSTSAEWTFAQLASVSTYLLGVDGNPDTHTTQVAIHLTFTPTESYTLDARITYSSVASSAQTTGFQVLCQGYRSGDTESVKVQAWNYTSSAWVDKVTISTGSDADYNFNLLGWAANCERSSGSVVLLRLVDASGGDATQTTAYIDVLKVNRIEQGYALDVDMTATSVAAYGNLGLQVKGYRSSTESFDVGVWNYTSSAWGAAKITISAGTNTLYTYDMNTNEMSGQQVKIRFTDQTAQASDTAKDTCFLDWAVVTLYHADPTITVYGALPLHQTYGSAIAFWATYTDADNEAPTWMYTHIDSTDYSMAKNNSGDSTYYDGCAYYHSKSDLAQGAHTYYFKTKDANSGTITTTEGNLFVHVAPTLTAYGIVPPTGNNGDTFYFFATYNDVDGDVPTKMDATIGGNTYGMSKNDSEDVTPPIAYHYEKALPGGTTSYHYDTQDAYSSEVATTPADIIVNNGPSLSGYGRTPGDPIYVDTELNFTVTYTDVDNDAPTTIKWREGGGATQNVTMSELDPADTTYSNGKDYYVLRTLGHGAHNYDYWASDGKLGVSGGSDTATITDRPPDITWSPATPWQMERGYPLDYTECLFEDPDIDHCHWSLSGNGSFASGGWLLIGLHSGIIISSEGPPIDAPGDYGYTPDAPGWWYMNVTIDDLYGMTHTDNIIVEVYNQAPIITSAPSAHEDEWRNTYWEYDFDATDADGDAVAWAKSGPAWLSVDSETGLLNGTTSDTPGEYVFTLWANDTYGGSDSYAFTLHLSNRAPVISSTGNTTQTAGTFMSYHILADDDDGDELTYELSTDADWLSIDGAWLNGTAELGSFEYTIWVNDSYGGSDSEHQFLEVMPPNEAPTFTSTPIYSVANNSAYYYDSNATDPNEDPIYYDLSTDCPYLDIDHDSGEVSGTPHQAGDYEVDISAFDGELITWQNFTLHVTTTAPSFTSSPIETCQNGTEYSYDADASDPESETLTFALTGNATFLTINATTGVVNGTMGPLGWYYVNISVTDGAFTVWQNFTLTSLNTPPSFTSSPDLTADLGAPYYYDANADDINGDLVNYSLGAHPAWMFINEATGEVEGTPSGYGSWLVQVGAFDGTAWTWQEFTVVCEEEQPYVPPEESPSLIGVIMMMVILALAMGLMFPLTKRRQGRRKNRTDSPKVAKDKEMEHGKRG